MGCCDDRDLVPKSMMPSGGGCCLVLIAFAVCTALFGCLIFA